MDDNPQSLRDTIRRYRKLLELNTDAHARQALEEVIRELEARLRDLSGS